MIKRLTILAVAVMMAAFASAQPQRRIQEQQAAAKNSATSLSVRAQAQYPVQQASSQDVSWRRDIYRELDLKKEANAALYYPEEPLGDRVNFFTLIFRLLIDGKISAYEYRLDGNELFTEENKLDVTNMLDKFYVYYEMDGDRIVVQPSDIPSAEVLKYYIKESNYIDHQTSSYLTRVTAVCPVLMRQDVSEAATPYPMFWLNYDEISPYLGLTPAMTSSFNNVMNMSLDDYFVKRCYVGEIYKTSNLRNQPIAEYCETDSLIVNEQKRIEQQLVDLESGLWASAGREGDVAGNDSTAVSKKAGKRAAKEKAVKLPQQKSTSQKSPKPAKEKAAKAPKASKGSSGGGRVSVNRGH